MTLHRSLLIVVAGVLLILAGLVWDTAGHASGAHDQATEELFTLDNPSHVLLGAGMALTIVGAALGLIASQARLRALSPASLVAVGLVSFAAAALAYGLSVDTTGHEHDPAVTQADVVSEEVLLDQLEAMGLTEEEVALVQTSRHDHGEELPIGATDLQQLADEVAQAMEVASRYESIEVALDAGYLQITQDLPLIGAHFLQPEWAADREFDIEKPEMLIYHFDDGRWQLYGLSYLSDLLSVEGDLPPEGFTGPFDVWHYHADWCFTLFGARIDTAEDCRLPLEFFAERTGFMTHVWFIDNPNGVFSHSHPALTGSPEYIVPRSLPLNFPRRSDSR